MFGLETLRVEDKGIKIAYRDIFLQSTHSSNGVIYSRNFVIEDSALQRNLVRNLSLTQL
jgi:hypothetical protein